MRPAPAQSAPPPSPQQGRSAAPARAQAEAEREAYRADAHRLAAANGRLVDERANYHIPRVLSFASQDIPIDVPTIERFRGRGDGTKELTFPELWERGHNPAMTPALRNAAMANFYFRMVEVLMMLIVPLFSVALAVPRPSATRMPISACCMMAAPSSSW